MQRDAVADDLRRFNAKYPQPINYGEDHYEDYIDRWEAMEKKKSDIAHFSQTLNYVLLHATKQGSEPHSIMMRVMRQSNGFESWRQLHLHFAGGRRAQQFSLPRAITQPTWDGSTKQFTKQYYIGLKTLELSRYEAENGARCQHNCTIIADHVKIATIVNNLKGQIGQQLMLRINQTTTFDEVHQWVSNYFNSTYAGVEDEKGTIGAMNDPDEEQYEKWTEETEEYEYEYNDKDVKGDTKEARAKARTKEERTIKELHAIRVASRATFHPNAQTKEARKDKRDRDNTEWLQWLQWRAIVYTGQPPAAGYNPKGKGYGKQPWHNSGKGKKGQLPVANIADYQHEDNNAYSETEDWNGYPQDWEQ
eukprot:4855670-Amphidinium_carterae.2